MKRTALLLLTVLMLLSGCVKAPTETVMPAESAAGSAEVPAGLRTFKTDGIVRNLAGSERLLAVTTSDSDFKNAVLTTYNPVTGEKLGTAALEHAFSDVVILSDGAALWDRESRTIHVCTDRMEPVWSRVLTPSETGLLFPDGSFYLFSDGSELTRFRLPDPDGCTVAFPGGRIVTDVRGSWGNRCMVACSDAEEKCFWTVDWDTGQLIPREQPDPPQMLMNRVHNVIAGSREIAFRLPESDTVHLLSGEALSVLQTSPAAALLTDYREKLLFVSFDRGTSRILPIDGFQEAVLCGRQAAFLPGGDDHAFTLWDPGLTGVDGPGVEALTVSGLSKRTRQLADGLQAQTGIPFCFGSDAVPLETHFSCSYEAEPVTDPMRIYISLCEIGDTLCSYPAGIFDEMRESLGTPIRFYLTGPLSGTGGDTVGSAQGLTLNDGFLQPVVLDITCLESDGHLHNTVVHELMHVMEERIFQTDARMLAYWSSFLPDAGLYFYSYHDKTGSEVSDFGYTCWSDAPDPLFLDPYSRTKPTEDRARLLEHLYLGEASEFADDLRQGTLQEKARYLCAVLREAFPSCRDADVLPWETLVEPVPYAAYEDDVNVYEPPSFG